MSASTTGLGFRGPLGTNDTNTDPGIVRSRRKGTTMTARHATRSRTSVASALAAAALSATVLAACGTDTGAPAEAATPLEASYHKSGHDDNSSHGRHNRHVSARIKLYTTMRSLWDQHMEWTWSTVVAFATDSPALPATLDRLLANQTDIGDTVGSFYGAKAGDQVTTLLETHINQAVPVLQAATAGRRPSGPRQGTRRLVRERPGHRRLPLPRQPPQLEPPRHAADDDDPHHPDHRLRRRRAQR